MTHVVELKTLQSALPNFPGELLEDWLLPYAKLEGWPPSSSDEQEPEGRWRYLLKKRALTYWRSIKWKQVNGHLSIHDLDPEWQRIMVDMVLGAEQGQVNLYSSSIKDLAVRFNRIKEHFSEHGIFPKPPALLLDDNRLTIVDGNHRIAAYFYCFGYFKLNLDQELKMKTLPEQTYWFGTV